MPVATQRNARKDSVQCNAMLEKTPSLFECCNACLNHFVWTSGYAPQRDARPCVYCELGFTVTILQAVTVNPTKTLKLLSTAIKECM